MNNYHQLLNNLRELKLTQISLQLDNYITKVTNGDMSIVDALYELTTKEIEIKNYNTTNAMVKVAGFPHLKEMKDFDFEFQPKINKKQFLDFESLRFLESNSNIILIGNSGVGNYRKFLVIERNECCYRLYMKIALISFDNNPQ